MGENAPLSDGNNSKASRTRATPQIILNVDSSGESARSLFFVKAGYTSRC